MPMIPRRGTTSQRTATGRRVALTLLISLALTLSAAACGTGRESGEVTRETLASGLERTIWHRLPEARLALDTLAVWHLWRSDSGYDFNQITAAAGSADGFFLLDSGNRQVVRVDRQGRPLARLGRRGSGPGEFEYPLELYRHGDELWVGDIALRRDAVFGPDDTFRRVVLWPGRGRSVSGGFAITPDEGMLSLRRSVEGFRGLLKANLDGSAVDTIAVMQTAPIANASIFLPGLGPEPTRIIEPPALTPEFHWCYGGGERVYTVTTAEYRIEQRDLAGHLLRELVAPTPDLAVTAADRRAYLVRTADLYGVAWTEFQRSNPGLEDRYPFAERRAAIEGIAVDPLGRLWVLANTAEGEGRRLDLFDRDQTLLGSRPDLPLPVAFTTDGAALFRIPGGDEGGSDLFFVARVEPKK
jgi:hypothetical protein